MEKFYLEISSIQRKDDIVDYINEFVVYNSDLNGMGSLDKILDGLTFEEALTRCLNMQNEEYARSMHRAQTKTFLLIRENDNRLIGTISVRWNLPKEMAPFCGNIGYGIRPTERRKGYNKINLYLGLLKAIKVSSIILPCDVDNLGSSKTMEALGGKFEKTEVDPEDGILTSVYSFNVSETIEKYKSKIENYIRA